MSVNSVMCFDQDLDAVEKSRQLIAKIEDLGLQPFETPEPLPPIQKDEVKLVCWMVVAPEEHEDEKQSSSGLISQMTLNSVSVIELCLYSIESPQRMASITTISSRNE